MTNKTPEQQALLLAGRMADYALELVGGRGLNGTIHSCHLDNFSEVVRKLRHATEQYNSHIETMIGDKQ